MQNVASRRSNPFGFEATCERFVPGYGDANAHFHVVGDHPGVHGGAATGVPFTDAPGADRLQAALLEADLLTAVGSPPDVGSTYFSYLLPCEPTGAPTDADYRDHEPLFDAELRAITAHVVLPVGERATRHVLATLTARPADAVDMDALHATEVHGAGWLVYPIKDPDAWGEGDHTALVDALERLQEEDYRREADLGRFLPGGETYRVR